MLRTKVLASSSGLAIGAFLFFRYSQLLASTVYSWIQPDTNWELLWYEAALFLGGIGLAGVFPAAWLWLLASLSMAVGAYGAYLVLVFPSSMEMPPLAAIALVGWLFNDFPAPLFGAAIGRLVRRTRIPQPLYFALLASVLMIGVSLPRSIQEAGKKHALDRAIARMERAIELDPKVASYYSHRGDAYLRKGDLDRAIADLTKAIELDPKVVQSYDLRGDAYAKKGDLDRAIADMNKAIELAPNVFYYYELRGNAYAKKGDLDRAIADLNKVIELLPNNPIAVGTRAHILEALGRKDEAIADFRRALALGRKKNDGFAAPQWAPWPALDRQGIEDALRRLGASP